MSQPQSTRTIVLLSLVTALMAYLSGPTQRFITRVGVLRYPRHNPNYEVVHIKDTIRCEDLHYLPLTNEIITACEDNDETTTGWHPGLGHLDNPNMTFHATLHVIDTNTLESRRLTFKNFHGEFVSHGLDVVSDPNDSNAYFIFAINHLPNPAYKAGATDVDKARSQIELFRYVSGSETAEHIRSIRHPLIITPNDIHADSPNSFYVTNDHHYREGRIRLIETLIPAAKWATTVYVELPSTSTGPEAGVTAHVALSNIHNNNGLGHVRNAQFEDQKEVIIASSASGVIHIAALSNDHKLTIVESIPLDITIDNPSYFADPYPNHKGDASGHVVCGLGRAIEFLGNAKDKNWKDPAMVYLLKKKSGVEPGSKDEWEKKLIFQDDGTYVRGATTALIVPIKPESKDSEKLGWLYITSILGKSTIAVKITL